MFKVRKPSRRSINTKEPLIQINMNKLETCISGQSNPIKYNLVNNNSNLFNNKSRIFKRPQTSKPKDLNQPKVQSSRVTNNSYVKTIGKVIEDKFSQRRKYQQVIRQICLTKHCEQFKALASNQQQFLSKLIQKILSYKKISEDQQNLQTLIKNQFEKIKNRKQSDQNYISCVSKIEWMLQDRLLKLTNYR